MKGRITRRRALVGIAGAVGLAGCVGGGDGDGTTDATADDVGEVTTGGTDATATTGTTTGEPTGAATTTAPAFPPGFSPGGSWPAYRGGAARAGSDPGTTAPGAGVERVGSYDAGGRVEGVVVADGTLFAAREDGAVVAFALDTGERRWTFDPDDGETSEGYLAVPAVAGGTVYVPGTSAFHAVDAATGESRWEFDPASDGLSPVVVEGTVYVATGDSLFALDTADGIPRWRAELDGPGVAWGPPAVAAGSVFSVAGTALRALDPATGEVAWTGLDGRYHEPLTPPAVAGGSLYLGLNASADDLGELHAFDADESRERRWSELLGQEAANRSPATPVAATDDVAVVAARDGPLWAVDADGRDRWRSAATGDWGTPVVAGETVLAVRGSKLVALDLTTGERRWSVAAGPAPEPAVVDGAVFLPGEGGVVDAYAEP